MKAKIGVALVVTVCLAGQERRTRGTNVNIVAAYPGVALRYERAGHRQPVLNDESTSGIWLTLRNNMKVPIYVRGFNADERGGLALLHEVVRSPSALPQEVGISSEGTRQGGQGKPTPAPVPHGYDGQHVSSVIGIAPGEGLLFSFPVEHMAPDQYIRVKFVYDWELKTESREPEHYVSFRFEQIPPGERSKLPIGRK